MNQNQDPQKESTHSPPKENKPSLTSQVLEEWNTLSQTKEQEEHSVTQMIQERVSTGKKVKKHAEKTPYSDAFLAKIGHFVEAPPTPIEKSPLEAAPVVKDPEEQLLPQEDPWEHSSTEGMSEESIIAEGLKQVSEGTWTVRGKEEGGSPREDEKVPDMEEKTSAVHEKVVPNQEKILEKIQEKIQESVKEPRTAPEVPEKKEENFEATNQITTPNPAPPVPSTPAIPPPTSQPMEIWEPWGNLVATGVKEATQEEKPHSPHQPPILSAGSLPPLPKLETTILEEFPLPIHSGRPVKPPQKTKTTPMVKPEEPPIAMTLLSPDDPLLTPPSLAEKSGNVEEIHTHLEQLKDQVEEKVQTSPKEHQDPLAMPPSLAEASRYQNLATKPSGEESLVMELESLDLWNQSKEEKQKSQSKQSQTITEASLKKFTKEMTRGEGNSVLDEVEREEEELALQAQKEEESKKKEARFKEQLTWEMEDLFTPPEEGKQESSQEAEQPEEEEILQEEPEEEPEEAPREKEPTVLTPEEVFEEDELEELESLDTEEEDFVVPQRVGGSSLIQMKQPHIIIEKPLSMKAGDEAKERARKEQEKRPQQPQKSSLISIQEPNFVAGKEEATPSNEEENLYDSIFDLDNLPSPHNPPPPKERGETEEIPFGPDDPLYDLIEAIREPLPTERFSNEIKETGESDAFATLLDQLSTPHLAQESQLFQEDKAEGASKGGVQGNSQGSSNVFSEIRADLNGKSNEKTEEPATPPRRTPYEDKSPWDLATGWISEGIGKLLPKDTLPHQDKQLKMITNMLVIAFSLGFMAVLVMTLISNDTPLLSSSTGVSVVQLDVNPSIRLTVDGKNKVTQVDAMNTEAQVLLNKSDLEGKTLEEVLSTVTELLFYHGYLQDSSTIFATVEDESQTRGEELSAVVKEDLDETLWTLGSSSETVGLWVDPGYDYSSKALEYQVSLGKMVIMQELFQVNPYFSLSNLSEYTQNELYQMYVSGTKMLPIGIDSAVELARQSALLSPTDSYSTKVTVSLSAVTPNYTVVFQTPSKEFFVQVDGYEGTILFSQELASLGITDDQNILPTEAKDIALNAVSVLEISTEDMRVTQDWSKGRLNYVVAFRSRDVEYKVTVFGVTGEVTDTQTTKVDVAAIEDVGQSRIQEIAFEDAGVTKDQLGGVTMDRSIKDEKMFYTLEFWSGSRQYSYELAGDGVIILSSFADYGDETTILNPMLMSETAAKDIALQHAGVNFSEIHSLTVGLNEYQNYVIEFLVGQTPYYYLLSGVTGEIYWYEKQDEVPVVETVVPEEDINDIGEEGAKQIALTQASLKDVMIQSFIITEEGEGKDKSYTVIFNFMNVGYYYKIAAETGEVLDRKQDFQQIQSTDGQNAPAQTQEEVYQQMLDDILNFNVSAPSVDSGLLTIPS